MKVLIVYAHSQPTSFNGALLRTAVETLEGYSGAATVATSTVTYDGLDPVHTVAVCDTADGRRCVALSDDLDVAAAACGRELVGTAVDHEHRSRTDRREPDQRPWCHRHLGHPGPGGRS